LSLPSSFTTCAVPSTVHAVSGVYDLLSSVEYSKDRFCTSSAYRPPSAARLMSSKKTPYIVSSIFAPLVAGSTVIA
jgi:hypothetical protein